MNTLTPWALGPFEILLHAETHFRQGEDLDRRIAIVGFDNAIELAIHTYLSLHPVQRQNKTYKKDEVEVWLENFHTKIDFFCQEVDKRGLRVECDKAMFIWFHEVRNGQYHVGGATIPQARELDGIRAAALWVFSVLFDVKDIISLIEQHLTTRPGDDLPKRTEDDDRAIDDQFGVVSVAGKRCYSSELIHRFDPVWYSELATELKERDRANDGMSGLERQR
jgi:hypothetical protein